VVASGTDGGGHSGFDQSTTLCLVPQVVDAVNIPVIAGGGIADGRQVFAALALGAEGVYVGTRFIATEECPAHDTFKRSILLARDGDTIAIRHGMPARYGSGNRGFNAERRGSLRLIMTDKIRDLMIEHSGLLTYDLLMGTVSAPNEEVGSASGATMVHGDTDTGFHAGGQGVGLIGEILPCREVVQELVREAKRARDKWATV
jgi:enoyl-[acyl-carrier protein] reductase II